MTGAHAFATLAGQEEGWLMAGGGCLLNWAERGNACQQAIRTQSLFLIYSILFFAPSELAKQ